MIIFNSIIIVSLIIVAVDALKALKASTICSWFKEFSGPKPLMLSETTNLQLFFYFPQISHLLTHLTLFK